MTLVIIMLFFLALWGWASLERAVRSRPRSIHIHVSGDLNVTHVHCEGRHIGDIIDGQYHRLR
jgi:hypothetical protein